MIGINTAIKTEGQSSYGSVGIGFAIPSNLAVDVADSIIKKGHYERPRIGIIMGQLNPVQANKVMGRNSGVFVATVFKDSPASRADIREGDILVKVDGEPVYTMRDVQRAIIKHKINEPVQLVIIRGGEEKAVMVLTNRLSDIL